MSDKFVEYYNHGLYKYPSPTFLFRGGFSISFEFNPQFWCWQFFETGEVRVMEFGFFAIWLPKKKSVKFGG
tara:strand:- start:10 stop:222 length:213 start_codon:yes stop_codon:yes gene_type:complete